MPTATSADRRITDLTTAFVASLAQAVEMTVKERMLAALGTLKRGPGRPIGIPELLPRKRAPKQLCPVPGCKNPAAPVFNMVCAKHKDLPKAKIKKYREQRRNRIANGRKTGHA